MKRPKNMPLEDYKIKRKEIQKSIKNYLKGKWFWKSKVVFSDPLKQLEFMKYGDPNLKSNFTYISNKSNPKISFTEQLRNDRDYDKLLLERYN